MKILNFGSLNLDNVYTVDHFIRPGETMSSEKLEIFCGGKGLNQSIALARAGAEVYHAGSVGMVDGERLLDIMKASGVDISLVKKTDGVSGHAVIQVDRTGQNCILLFGGANKEITKEQIEETLDHFDAGDVLLMQNETSEPAYMIQRAAEKGMQIYLNPSPVTAELLTLPLDKINCFILNEIEAADLCREEVSEKKVSEDKLPELLYRKYPGAAILLTLGEKGSIYYDGEHRLEQAAYSADVVDTTGAGDTFTGYFIAAISGGSDIEPALKRAAKAASIAVSRKGAAVSIPWEKEV
ncbi:MAG: ribokinase [Clostridium sp.]